MDETWTEPDFSLTGPIEHALASPRARVDEMSLHRAADPDGELTMLDRVLRMKRGCRRGR